MRPENFVAASELLERAAEAGVFLSYGQERLHFKLSADVFPESLKSEIIEHKAALIEFLRCRELDNGSTLGRPRIVAQVRESNELPASFAQQRLWFIDQLSGGSPHYNMPAGLRIQGRFNEEIAERALRHIIERHEPLRTVFRNGAETPLQHIREQFDFKLERIDLSGQSREEQEQQVREAAEADAFKPFDLSSDLMLRACFICLAADEGVLLFNMHHIAADGWSTSILMNEFSTLYEAFSQGKPDPLPRLVVQYSDYAHWQREWLAGEVLERQLSYWEQQLAELMQVHGLPLDHPRPPAQTFNGAVHHFTLAHETLAALKQLVLAEQATLFMVLQGVFALLLSRHSNSHDIVMGTPVANRLQKELEPLVGLFVNTLVLRIDCRPGRTFREYLGELKRLNLNAQANQDVPFEYLVERLKPQRSTSHAPLFQIMFSMQTNGVGVAQLPGLSLTPLACDSVAVKFDLTLDAIEDVDCLRLSFAYNTDLFEKSTIVRLGEHFRNLAREVSINPDRQIEALPLLSQSERNHLLYELNETAADYPRDSCIPELFEAQVKLRPESVALVYAGSQLNYRELNEQANQLAHYLREKGVGPETLVALCVERSPAMLVGLLGILKSGGAYVPLDPGHPPERLEYMIEDSKAAIVLTESSLEHCLPKQTAAVKVFLDQEWDEIRKRSAQNIKSEASAENLAYVIYTSGSTGKPKGVQVTHRNLVNFLSCMQLQPGLTAEDTLAAVTTIAFDIAGLELYLPLTTGARVVLAPRETAADGKQLAALLRQSQATVIQATPATWRLLLSAGWYGPQQLKVLCGGEALPTGLARELRTVFGDSVFNLYGPTETTIWSAMHKVNTHDAQLPIVPLGQPIGNTQLYLLDEQLEPVPVGVQGELYIGGDGVARGYWGRAELTAERFTPDPFSRRGGERLYRTGDHGRYLANGEIEYLGRADHQVKIRGFRIELGEIEATLGEHPMVRDVAVLVREDSTDDKRIVAYVVLNRECATAVEELRRVIKEKLPSVMMPSAFVVLESMPLTPNGKIDRKELPAPDQTRPDIAEAFAPPRTPIEEMLAAIWSQTLRLEKVGIHDNFFNIGGHSLLAAQVISRVHDTFKVELPLRVFFETPTIAALAAYIARIQVREADDAALSAALAKLSQLSPDEMKSLRAAQGMSTTTRSLS
jgi:amino acid adenylation domain-containing protein